MASKSFIPTSVPNSGKRIAIEKYFLEKHYSFLKVVLANSTLECIGRYQPSEHSATYVYRIRFTPGKPPKVFVTSPKIIYDENVHMYRDGSLCLYYPKDYNWTNFSNLYNTIVPWTHEWFVFYELYQLTGEWKHPFVDHKRI
jgi:hypothetical protein